MSVKPCQSVKYLAEQVFQFSNLFNVFCFFFFLTDYKSDVMNEKFCIWDINMIFCHKRASTLICKQITLYLWLWLCFSFIRNNDHGYFKKPKGSVLIVEINLLTSSLALMFFLLFCCITPLYCIRSFKICDNNLVIIVGFLSNTLHCLT